MLEGVFDLGKATRFVEEVGRHEVRETAAELIVREVGDGSEKSEINTPSDHGGRLEQPLLLERKAVDPRCQHCLDGRGHLNAADGPGEAVCPRRAHKRLRLDEAAHGLLQEEGIAVRPVHQELLEGSEGGIDSQECPQQLLRELGGQWVDPQLGEVRFRAPGMTILGAIVDEQEDAFRRERVDQAAEERLSLEIDPVKVLDNHAHWPSATLSKQEALRSIHHAGAALRRVESLPNGIINRHIEEGEEP